MKLRPLVARSRGLAAAAIVALALGIGLTALMFAIIDGTVRRGLPAPDASEIVHLERLAGPGEEQGTPFLVSDRETLAEGAGLSALAAFRSSQTNLSGDGLTPRRWEAASVTANTFATLGVSPSAGALFDGRAAAEGVTPIVISGTAWRDQFAAAPSTIGRAVRVNGLPALIVGIMPDGFRFPVNTHVWMPLDERAASAPVSFWGRLAPGFSRASASQALTARYATRYAGTAQGEARVSAEPFTASLLGPQFVGILETMFLAGLGVLVIACANAANLLLARGLARRRDFAISSALGASRARLMRERITEGLLMAAPGAAMGVVLTYVGAALFNRAIAGFTPPYWVHIAVDARVLAYVVIAAMVTALVAAALPALQSGRAALSATLGDETRSTTGGTLRRTTAAFVVIEIALAAAMLACAGLMTKGVLELSSQSYVFAVDDVMTGRLLLPARAYASNESRREFYVSLHTRLQELRASRAAGLGSSLPFLLADTVPFSLDARDADPSRWPEAHHVLVSPGYFSAMGVGPLVGRDIEESDREERAPVALVNLSFAMTFARRDDLIGKTIRIGRDAPVTATIVGIVPDLSVGNPRGEQPQAIYVPLLQQERLPGSISLVARASSPPEAVERELRAAVAEIDPELPLDRVVTLASLHETTTWFYRVFGLLFLAFGLGALLLALVGVYAVMSFAVTRRRREIGTRMALGATGADIARMFLREGAVRLAAGLGAGVLLAAIFTPRLSLFLFRVDPRDSAVFALALAIVGAVGLSACAVPALRAARQAPVESLRDER